MAVEHACMHVETFKDIKTDVKELKSDVYDLKLQTQGFSHDLESLVKQLSNLTTWIKWLVITLVSSVIAGTVGLGFESIRRVIWGQ